MSVALEIEPLDDAQVEQVNANLALARSIANESKERRIDIDDRYQAACLGLIRAVQSHDPAKGTLATHAAWCIRGAIQQAARKSPSMTSLGDLDGYEPLDQGEDVGLEPIEAARLRAVVESLPEQARSPIISRFWRNRMPRGRANDLAVGLDAIRRATQGGRSIPVDPPTWSDPDGRPISQDRMSPDDAAAMKAMARLRLRPLFPPTGFTRDSKCPHDGPIPAGSNDVCMVCHACGQDDIRIPTDVKALPVDRPKPAPPPPPAKESRKERRKRIKEGAAA